MTSKTDQSNPAANGGWMETYSGRRIEYYNPAIENISILDISHSLAMQSRYTGHTSRYYSVAEHCVLAAMYAEQILELPAEKCLLVLMHDAAEAFIGDIASPLKHLLPEYRKIEGIMERAVQSRFGLLVTPEDQEIIKRIDYQMLATERAQLLPASGLYSWNMPDWATPLPAVYCRGLPPEEAQKAFIQAFERYTYASLDTTTAN